MENGIKRLELHIVRLEQAIRQVQRLSKMGLPQDLIDEKINGYLDEILKVREEIEMLKKQK